MPKNTLIVEPLFSLISTEYRERSVTVDFSTGKTLPCRVPVLWSDNACATMMSKYAARAGVSDECGGVDGREVDAERIFDRMVAGWRATAVAEGYWSEDDPNLDTFCAEIKAMLEQQRAAPNSPQWFNTGLAVQYGIKAGADGHYKASVNERGEVFAHSCADSLEFPQVSACFIQSVDDNLVGKNGIMDLWQREARLFKYGSGSGANYSSIRGKGEPLSRGGTSSGLLSFLRVGDSSAGAIKSGGTTRRSARMVVVDVDHPDVEEFIGWKAREDDKIRALHAAGYGDPSSFEDEATQTVSGQNANNSVAVSDKFMRAVGDDSEWHLTARVDGSTVKTVQARDMWQQIAEASWRCADPGLQFSDTINAWHTCKTDGRITATNPCQPGFAPVLTPDGIRTFDDIKVGSTIWSGQRWTQVKRKIATGVKPVQVYHTTAGRVIATGEHRVFEQGERVEVQHADAIDTAQAELPEAAPLDPRDVLDGLVFGDGCTQHGKTLLLIGAKDDCYHDSEITSLLVRPRYSYVKCGWEVKTTLGALPCTYLRKVPEQFYCGCSTKVRGFLRGLYSANGSVVGKGKCGRVTLKASSFAVICAVQEMLSSLGIRSYYTTNKANEVEFANGTYLCKQSYDLNITSDATHFAELIGFVHPYKTKRLIEVVDARRAVGKHPNASCKPKTTYEIKHVENLGKMPVFDIEVVADEHCYWSGGHLVSNCSEYVFLDDTACNLASLNLSKFIDDDYFDFAEFEHAARLWTIVLDISVSMAGYPTAEIAKRSMLYRTLGLGHSALGEALVMLGLGYGTQAGRDFAADVTSRMTCTAYRTSAELAQRLEPFPRFAANREHVLNVLDRHSNYATDYATNDGAEAWDDTLTAAQTHGVRNAQVTLLAPCGTIGIIMDCDTTGVEPYYSDTTVKTLAGGGVMRLASRRFAEALGAFADFCTSTSYTVEQGQVREYVWTSPPDHLQDVLVCADDLSPEQHIDMMAAVQPFLSGAISKTINCPADTTPKDIAALHTYAWEQGLKSIALYRDGCKPAQPLQGRKPPAGALTFPTREEAEHALDLLASAGDSAKFEGIALAGPQPTTVDSPRLARGARAEPPATATAVKHRIDLAGHTFYLLCGEYPDGTLAEVFVVSPRTGSSMSGWLNAWAKMFSLGLQHGTPLAVLLDAMRGETFEPAGWINGRAVTSPVDAFVRVLEEHYASDDTEPPEGLHATAPAGATAAPQRLAEKPTGGACDHCGSMSLVRSGSCYVCRACGSTTGCS